MLVGGFFWDGLGEYFVNLDAAIKITKGYVRRNIKWYMGRWGCIFGGLKYDILKIFSGSLKVKSYKILDIVLYTL